MLELEEMEAMGSLSLRLRWRRHKVVLAVVCGLLLAVAFVFGRTVGHPFIHYDDREYVYGNRDVLRGLTARGIVWAFTHIHSCNWHPLTWISHQLDCQVYGQWAGGHHLTSVLLHAINIVLLLLVLKQMTGQLWPSVMTAAVVAVHPLRVESVAWVAERKDLLSALFFMLTLIAYTAYATRPLSWIRYTAVALLFALGLMAKPMIVTLPGILLLLDYWPLRRLETRRENTAGPCPESRSLAWLVMEKIPLLALSVACCTLTVLTHSEAMGSHYPFPVRLENAAVAYAAYLGMFAWPVKLAVLYPHPGTLLPIVKLVPSVLILLGITAAAAAWRDKRPYLIVGWLWYLGMMLPVIGLVQVGAQAMADRYTYLPQIGVVVALAWSITEACHRRLVCREALVVLSVAWLLGLMVAAWHQAGVWRNSESLWRHTLACTRENYLAHANLEEVLGELGRLDEAIEEGQASLRINPNCEEVHFDLGMLLRRKGKSQEAIACFQEALRLKPDYLDALNCLANDLGRAGRYKEAATYYARAMVEGPAGAPAFNNFGGTLLAQGKATQAIALFREAIKRDPTYAAAYHNLGNALVNVTQMDEAISCYEKALELKPDFTEAQLCVGLALIRVGRLREAATHLRPVVAERPNAFSNNSELDRQVRQLLQFDRRDAP